MPDWLIIAIALGIMLALAPVVRWFGLRLQRLVLALTGSADAALYFYHFLLLPGTLVHELAHWLTAHLLGVRTGRLSLMPVRQGQQARFGSVQIQRSDPVRASIIGAAPLLAGTLLALAVVRYGLRIQGQIGLSLDDLGRLWQALRTAPDAPLWFYLLIALTNAMLPSESDRQAWPWVVGGLVVIAIVLYLLDRLAPVLAWLARPASALALVGAITMICDLAIGLVAFLIELGIVALFGSRAESA